MKIDEAGIKDVDSAMKIRWLLKWLRGMRTQALSFRRRSSYSFSGAPFWLCELDFRHSTVQAVRGAQITLSESLEHPQQVSRAT